jgi:inner membrane transporter RhtA
MDGVTGAPDPRQRRAGVALVIGAVSIIQFGSAFAATLFDEVGAGGTVFLRLGFASLVLLAIWRPTLRGHAPRDLRVALIFGLALGGMNWSFYEAIDRIPLGVAVTIEMVGPLGVAVAGSRRAIDVLWVTLAATGVLLLSRPWEGGGDLDLAGVGLAVLAGSFWAAYILLSARTGKLFPGGTGLALAMAVAALVCLPAGVVQGGSDLLVPGILASGAAVALLSSVIPYSLELEALRRVPAAVFGVLMSLEPAFATLAGFLVLDQALGAGELLAIGLVVSASLGATTTSEEPAPPLEA